MTQVEFQEKKVFILGLPGSGKSTAARCIEMIARDHRWNIFRLSDYDILYKMFKADQEGKQFSKTQGYDGFDVHDFTVCDIALEKLEAEVWRTLRASQEAKRLVCIEFARADYNKALNNFTDDFLNGAHVLFIRADIPTCRMRIEERAKNPQTSDDHFVSPYIFESYYHLDDGRHNDTIAMNLARVRDLQLQVDVIDNPATLSLPDFYAIVKQYIVSIMDEKAEFTIKRVQEAQQQPRMGEEHDLPQHMPT